MAVSHCRSHQIQYQYQYQLASASASYCILISMHTVSMLLTEHIAVCTISHTVSYRILLYVLCCTVLYCTVYRYSPSNHLLCTISPKPVHLIYLIILMSEPRFYLMPKTAAPPDCDCTTACVIIISS